MKLSEFTLVVQTSKECELIVACLNEDNSVEYDIDKKAAKMQTVGSTTIFDYVIQVKNSDWRDIKDLFQLFNKINVIVRNFNDPN